MVTISGKLSARRLKHFQQGWNTRAAENTNPAITTTAPAPDGEKGRKPTFPHFVMPAKAGIAGDQKSLPVGKLAERVASFLVMLNLFQHPSGITRGSCRNKSSGSIARFFLAQPVR